MYFFSVEPTKVVADKIRSEFRDLNGLEEVLNNYLVLEDFEVYEKLVFSDNRVDSNTDELAIKNFSVLENLASENLSRFPLRLPFTPLITIHDFFGMYWFLGNLYSIYIGHDLVQEELNQSIHGNLATRLIFLLENFDKNIPTPEPNAQFFKNLSKLKWEKNGKKLFKKLDDLAYVRLYNKWPESNVSFNVSERALIRFLSGCSAVLNGHKQIKTNDILHGHETYLKLIKTDISKLM